MDLGGRTAVITGANRGIGKETARILAGLGANVVLACRDSAAADRAALEVQRHGSHGRTQVLTLDLASHHSIRAFAAAFTAHFERLDLLVNNAAVVPWRCELTVEGFEAQFGVGHLGHFLLTHLLLPSLRAAAPSRIVTVSSESHRQGTLDFCSLRGSIPYDPIRAYCQTKLANILFTKELGRRLTGSGVQACAVSPGFCRTAIHRSWPLRRRAVFLVAAPASHGAARVVYAAIQPTETGSYLSGGRVVQPSALASDPDLAARLWRESDMLIADGAANRQDMEA